MIELGLCLALGMPHATAHGPGIGVENFLLEDGSNLLQEDDYSTFVLE